MITCPKCGSVDLHPLKKGGYICEDCEYRFTPDISDAGLYSGKTDRPLKIFISYAHAQGDVVDSIMRKLKNRGHQVWFDAFGITHGDDWRKEITDGLTDSNGVVSFLSKEAIRKGGVCLDELGIAVGVKYGNLLTVLLQKEKDLQPIPAQLSRRQWLDMSDWNAIRTNDPEAYQAWLDRKTNSLIGMIESDETREFEGQISLIRDILKINDQSISRQAWYLRQPFVGREWLTQRIEAWLNDPAGGHMCAVYGGPGTGKSAFAAQYVYHNYRVAASIFFEHGNEHFNSPEAIVRELVFQLAARLPEYRSLLVYELENIKNPAGLNTQEQFQRLLAVPLQHTIGGGHETMCIVVDGLDECTEEGKRQAAELLSAEHFPDWLRILVLSRKEAGVIGGLRPDLIIEMTGDPESNIEDIRAYYQLRLESQLGSRPDGEKLLQELTDRAKGVFLYAFIVSDMILHGKLQIEETETYPRDMNESFMKWFKRYFADPDEYDRLYKLPLGIIAACEHPVPVEELETADGEFDRSTGTFRLRERKPGERMQRMTQRLERCAPLLRYAADGFGNKTVCFSHRYIAEWLTGTDESIGQNPAAEYSCSLRDAMWAVERAWRNRLENKETLTVYQALNLLDMMIFAEEPEAVIRMTASDKGWEKVLVGKQNEFAEDAKWEETLLFARANHSRCRRAFGDEHPETLSALLSVADTLDDLGNYHDALEIHQQVYEARKRILGEEHPDTLSALCNLSVTLSALGRFPEALENLEKVYEIQKRILGEEDPAALTTLNNLAYTLREMGRVNDSIGKTRTVYETRRKILGEEHPDTLSALNSLAYSTEDIGQHQEAYAMKMQVWEIRKRILGEDHPDTLTALGGVAYSLGKLRKHKKALELQKQIYEADKKILGENHPKTVTALSNLAYTLGKIGKHEEALEKKRQVYESRKQSLGEDHPKTLTALAAVAYSLEKLDRKEEALHIQKEIYETDKRILDENHPKTLAALNSLAITLYKLDRCQEAAETLGRVYEARKRILGEEHQKTLNTLYDLANCLFRLGRKAEAAEMMTQVFNARQRTLGETHPDTLRAASDLRSFPKSNRNP